ncbi:MAG: FAD:protein FMN transferase, partial [Candidatus Sericytochromatia bacterium]|nr:FAD:protein FMN transferase [Candidatus Tanganyikabacteria bacterium]
HPREEGKVLGVTAPGIGGISTSGDAERGFWRYGVRYGHILDPRTGEPARDTLSVTVACRKAEEADALSTTLYVLGPDRGLGLLQAHPGCHAVFVRTADQPGEFRLIESPGFAWADAPR